jgi:hypothetical protein
VVKAEYAVVKAVVKPVVKPVVEALVMERPRRKLLSGHEPSSSAHELPYKPSSSAREPV